MDDNNNRIQVNKNIVEKHIRRYYDISHIPFVQNMFFDMGIKCPQILDFEITDNKDIRYQYTYIDGGILNCYSCEIIKKIRSIVLYMSNINCNNICTLKFYDKVDFYLENIEYNVLDEKTQKSLRDFAIRYKSIKEKKFCRKLIHGDLDLSNIIFTANKEIVLIDFDECCLAPDGMDWVIFLVRLLHKFSTEDINFIVKNQLIEELKKQEFDLIELYIIKIISEKIFLIQQNVIDVENQSQAKDSYQSWFGQLQRFKRIFNKGF